MVSKTPESPFPGFQFLERVTAAWIDGLQTQAALYGEGWARLRSGRFGLGEVGKAFADSIDAYYGVLRQAARTLTPDLGPAMVMFKCSVPRDRGAGRVIPDALSAVLELRTRETLAAELARTPFLPIGGGAKLDDAAVAECDWVDTTTRDKIRVTLEPRKLASAEPGVYVSFVSVKQASERAPLAIVLLEVS